MPVSPGVEAFDRAALGEVERLALRDALGDVEQDDVAQFLHRRQMRERATDHAGADRARSSCEPWGCRLSFADAAGASSGAIRRFLACDARKASVPCDSP